MYKINGRTRTTRKQESSLRPVVSGACSGRLPAPLRSRCPSVILTLGGASPSRCARRRRPSPGSVRVGWLVGCLTSQQHASASQGRICSDNSTCCHTEIEVPDQTVYFTQSQYTDTEPTSPSADPITPGAWQGSHWSANF